MYDLVLLAIASLSTSFELHHIYPHVSADLLDSISLLCFLVPVTARTYQARPIYNSLTDYQQPDPRWISLCHRAPPKQRGALLCYGYILSSDITDGLALSSVARIYSPHVPATSSDTRWIKHDMLKPKAQRTILYHN
jgi:hypothetical protein